MARKSWSFADNRRVIELANKASMSLDEAARIMKRSLSAFASFDSVGRFIRRHQQEKNSENLRGSSIWGLIWRWKEGVQKWVRSQGATDVVFPACAKKVPANCRRTDGNCAPERRLVRGRLSPRHDN